MPICCAFYPGPRNLRYITVKGDKPSICKLYPSARVNAMHSYSPCAGVTPLLGARHIQVGRDIEIAALEKNLDHIADGGSAFRLVIGEYGSGKTFS